jgi:hypothetical protein
MRGRKVGGLEGLEWRRLAGQGQVEAFLCLLVEAWRGRKRRGRRRRRRRGGRGLLSKN